MKKYGIQADNFSKGKLIPHSPCDVVLLFSVLGILQPPQIQCTWHHSHLKCTVIEIHELKTLSIF